MISIKTETFDVDLSPDSKVGSDQEKPPSLSNCESVTSTQATNHSPQQIPAKLYIPMAKRVEKRPPLEQSAMAPDFGITPILLDQFRRWFSLERPDSAPMISLFNCDDESAEESFRCADLFEDHSLLQMFHTPKETKRTNFQVPKVKTKLLQRASEDESTLSTKDDDSNQRAKGLRLISKKVKHIVITKRQVSFKDVSDLVVMELRKEKYKEAEKDEKNVRRRVYDALNVLLAANIFVKAGKMVLELSAMKTKEPIEGLMKKKSELEVLLKEKRAQVEKKRKRYKELLAKKKALTNLITRNKKTELISPAKEKIQFPFILMKQDGFTKMRFSLSDNKNNLKILSNHPVEIYSEIEALLLLKLHK